MRKEGPILDQLTHRLAECPAEFLAEPRIGKSGQIYVDAVVNDLILDLGGNPPGKSGLIPFCPIAPAEYNRLRLTLVSCWLLHDPWFIEAKHFANAALFFLSSKLGNLSSLVDPTLFVSDPDRREELVRMCLAALGLRPQGETEAQAADRLTTLDSVERSRIIRDTQEKQKRARELREQMRKKEAAEAAAKATRE